MSKRFPGQRLSWLRISVVLVAIGGVAAASASGLRTIKDEQTATGKSWYAGYVDVTATPRFAFETPATKAARDVVLSFVVSSPSVGCEPTWGGAYSLDEAGDSLDLDRRIARLRQSDGSVIVSFGGQRNSELAVGCNDRTRLKAAYRSVIDRYDVRTIDLDLEGPSLADAAANARRAGVLTELQREREADGSQLAVWLTLPVAPTGLTEQGTQAVSDTLASGLKIAGVNVMTMDYGAGRKRQESMAATSIRALKAAHGQLQILNRRAGNDFGPATTWKRMGATPMLGQNDVPAEVFSVEDARKLNAFVTANGLGRLSVWSLNRDRQCGSNYADVKVVSVACSGIRQAPSAFSKALGDGLTGVPDLAGADPRVAESTPQPTTVTDDPKTSPYPIWSGGQSYLANTKVVWRRNVYIAKYWTRGDTPDNPVLQPYETPWTLLGPVLPGETPVVPLKLPKGTYASWSPGKVYRRGSRTMLEGIAFEAKWWTQGDNPMSATTTSETSPWARLTDGQIRSIKDRLE